MNGIGLLIILPTVIVAGPHERRLINDLMRSYKNLERPVANESEAVVLKFGLTLQQIMDVDERNQMISTNLWLNLEWHDSNLVWNETEYGLVKDIRMPPASIWKPDILMYNSASEAFDGTYQTNVVVTSGGMCTYIPPGIFKSSCQIDITWFPFDDQDCNLKFGSWTYNGFNLDLKLNSESGGDTSTFISNGEWDLVGVPAIRNEVIYDCCPEPYLDITFTIKIRRRTLYYFTNLIVPCLLIASMAVLGFTLPPDSGEKLSLGVTIMLAITIFSSIIGDMLPVTDTTPLIGMYFSCIMFMVSSSCIVTILILNYHHRLADTHEMPEWVQAVFLQWMPWLLHMSRPGEKITRKTIMMANKMKELDMKETSSKSLLSNVLDMDDDFRSTTLPTSAPVHHPSHVTGHQNAGFVRNNNGLEKILGLDERSNGDLNNGEIGKKSPKSQLSGLHRELGAILKEIKVITDKIRDEDETSTIEADWKFAAMVLDRICLILFSLFTFIATVTTLAVAPHVLVW